VKKGGEHAPLLRDRDCISPNLGEGSLVDGCTGIWPGRCTYDSSKQGNDRKTGVPHSVQRSGGTGAEKAIRLTEMVAFIMKWRLVDPGGRHEARCMAQDQEFGLDFQEITWPGPRASLKSVVEG